MKKLILSVGMILFIQQIHAQLANNGLSQVVSIGSVTYTQLGQICNQSGSPGKLLGHREIPMNNYNLYFSGQGSSTVTTHAVAVGYTACVALPAKFSTLRQSPSLVGVPTIAGSFINNDQLTATTSGDVIAVMGVSDKPQSGPGITNVAGDFHAGNALQNIGIAADAVGGPGSAGSIGGQFTSVTNNPGANIGIAARGMGGTTNTGINASGNGGTNSFGVYAIANSALNNNHAVYANAGGGSNSYAIYGQNSGAAPNHWAGYFQGDVQITGNLWNNTTLIFSDKRLKRDIQPLQDVTEKLKKLNGYTYNFRAEEFKERNFDSRNHIGLIAQEIKEVFPQLVTEDAKGFYAVDYQGMIPVLLEAIKEQQQQIDELKALVKGSSDNNNINAKTVSSVTLNDAQVIVLEQNVPNPFAEQTSIAYNLNEGVQKAQILFYNADGKLVNTSELKAKAGKGQLNVFAGDLSNGLYYYTLVVDGSIVETKRMIKTK